ncbi:MAG: hypothetical protein J6D30_04630 [Clostridia bacterium]|nr:hypothetical protein [Clostridia bacterium]MBP3422565.1 hypothetical protein [Clostridia bacterium]
MKLKKILLGVLLLLVALIGGACSSEADYSGKTKIIFELEGGTYQNCVRPIVHYYDFAEGTENLIAEPNAYSKEEIARSGYHIEGWYKTKIEDGETVEYTDRWDFATDKVGVNGVTLYAKWKKNINYSYNVCYYDDNGQVQVLGTYTVDAGAKFDDYANYAKRRIGYTALGYKTKDGEEWDKSFTHPGGETDLAINVYVEYIEGTFSIVSTASQLKANKNKNIYLTADIDFGGAEFGFGDYNKTLIGNGHTISNFKLQYDASKSGLREDYTDSALQCMNVALFGNTNGAVIKDVHFKDVTVEVRTTLSLVDKIYVAPLAVSMKDTKVENVTFEGTFGYSRLPTVTIQPDDGAEEELKFKPEEDLIFVDDQAYYQKDEKTTVEGVTFTIDVVGKIEE